MSRIFTYTQDELEKINLLLAKKKKLEEQLRRVRSCWRFGFSFFGEASDVFSDKRYSIPYITRQDIEPIIQNKLRDIDKKLKDDFGVEEF